MNEGTRASGAPPCSLPSPCSFPAVSGRVSDPVTPRPLVLGPPTRLPDLLALVRASGLVDEARLQTLLESEGLPDDPVQALDALVRAGLLTAFHACHLRQGRFRGFVLGPYRVLQPLGKGGMGLVYLAEHRTLGQRVALKVLRTDLPCSPGALERFYREGRAAAALDHPNIVRVQDVCRSDDDHHFLAMEYVEGKSLEDVIQEEGRLSLARAVDYALQVARGLGHAHERGLVHRDIKPGNLLLDRQGTVKILDMGLARFYTDKDDKLTERVGGGILGSPDYIAPEQALNKLDTRSDIYSLGATLYCLLLGRPPFPFNTARQKLLAHQMNRVTPPHCQDANIPPELSAAVVRMLAREPDARYQTIDEVIAALEPWLSLPEPVATTTSVPPPSHSRLRYGLAAAGFLAVALLAGLAAWAL